MSDVPAFRNALGRVPSGYGERHVRKVWFGIGEARLCSLVSKDRRYEPVVRSDGAQRESDGVVVPLIAGMNPAEGKGPDFGQAGRGRKREGMAGTARSNYPRKRERAAKVRQLQNRLWAAAKQSEGRRFHALYDRIYRPDILWEAWERVRANRGAAGVDGLTVAAVEDYGVHRMLDELAGSLRAGTYHPAPVRRVEIDKPDGSKRPLGIPTVVDRCASRRRRRPYYWLAHRLYTVRKPVVVPWALLARQVGSQYAQVREFKAQVVKQLRVISLAYPQARVNVTGAGLMLGPSPLPVPRQTVLELSAWVG